MEKRLVATTPGRSPWQTWMMQEHGAAMGRKTEKGGCAIRQENSSSDSYGVEEVEGGHESYGVVLNLGGGGQRVGGGIDLSRVI